MICSLSIINVLRNGPISADYFSAGPIRRENGIVLEGRDLSAHYSAGERGAGRGTGGRWKGQISYTHGT